MFDATNLSIVGAVVALVTAIMRIIEILLRKLTTEANFSISDQTNLKEIRDWTKSLYDLYHNYDYLVQLKNTQLLLDKTLQDIETLTKCWTIK